MQPLWDLIVLRSCALAAPSSDIILPSPPISIPQWLVCATRKNRNYSRNRHYSPYCHFFFFSDTSTFQLLDKPWSQVSSLLSPGSYLQCLSRIGFSNPSARRFFIECCLLALSRFPQVNLCTRKSPNKFIRVCTRRGSNSRTDLYQARG